MAADLFFFFLFFRPATDLHKSHSRVSFSKPINARYASEPEGNLRIDSTDREAGAHRGVLLRYLEIGCYLLYSNGVDTKDPFAEMA